MVFVVTLVGLTVTALAYTLPGRFLLDAMAGDRAVWHMPRAEPATIYLTFDDGPNPSTTPALLDVLEGEGVSATFFLIDTHVTGETAPLVPSPDVREHRHQNRPGRDGGRHHRAARRR